ncbi:hypothetical protein HN682_00785 [Candidatus Peregrinibacteria bacterium]|jgi:hypothetical protein|nr:hypothetical protein [Candidatus Peregrinibacteria bacterium]
MKTRLLKILRAKFYVEYYPSTKQYRCVTGDRSDDTWHSSKESAITQRECNIINYGRKYYRKYSKHIKIT